MPQQGSPQLGHLNARGIHLNALLYLGFHLSKLFLVAKFTSMFHEKERNGFI